MLFSPHIQVHISIHASAKEATLFQRLKECLLLFQSTPPRRRRHVSIVIPPKLYLFQSTPPRRRRPPQTEEEKVLAAISIHASAKEATRLLLLLFNSLGFQSTPPRRRRLVRKQNQQSPFRFQSTPPRRRRLLSGMVFMISMISIHASAKEAT